MVPGPITQFLGPVPAVSRDHIPCLHIPLPRTQRGLSMTLPLPGPGSLAAEGARQTTPPPSTTNPGPHSPSALGQEQPLQSYVQAESRGHPWSLSSAVQYCWVLDRTDDSCLPQASSTPRHQARPFHGSSQLTPHYLEEETEAQRWDKGSRPPRGKAAAAPLPSSPTLIPEASVGRRGRDGHVSKDPSDGPPPHIPPSWV